jgi:hypothetical protein
MNRTMRVIVISLVMAFIGACATTPKGPPPEVVRLQHELDRLHADPRIAANADKELRDADVAVNTLARDGRRLDEPVYRHQVYLADRLVQTAEAAGAARYAEQRAKDLGVERDRLVIDAKTRDARNAQALAAAALSSA